MDDDRSPAAAPKLEWSPEDVRRMHWVWGTCIAGTLAISAMLAWQTDRVNMPSQPMEVNLPYKLFVLAAAAVAGGLWGVLPKKLVRRYGSWVWIMVLLGLVGAVILGQSLQQWLISANFEKLFFPLTRAAWDALANDIGGFILFIILVPITFFVDLFLAIPVAIALPFLPLAVLTAGPLVGALAGAGIGQLGLKLFVPPQVPRVRRAPVQPK
jgi:uncharacterized membrane protein YeaQ/YmgE (transglycosylase-associated protein family)